MRNPNFLDSLAYGFRDGMINNFRWNMSMPYMNPSMMFMSMPLFTPTTMFYPSGEYSLFTFTPSDTQTTSGLDNSLFNFSLNSSKTTNNNTSFLNNAFNNFNFSIGDTFTYNTSATSGTNTAAATGASGDGTNRRVDTKSGMTAAQLNKSLSGVLSGKGQKFLDAEDKYGVNAAFLVAICRLESGNGTSDPAKNRNNVAGIDDGKRNFNSVDECIEYTANLLANGKYYFTRGKKTIAEIGQTYCGPSWAPKVSQLMDEVLAKKA